MNPDVSQVFRPNLATLPDEGDCSIPQGRFRAAAKPNPLRTIPIPLSDSLCGLWRTTSWNIVFVVRGFVGPGEPRLFVR